MDFYYNKIKDKSSKLASRFLQSCSPLGVKGALKEPLDLMVA